MSQKQQSEWINEFNERFIRDGIIEAAGEPVKSFISAQIQQARAELIAEQVGKIKGLREELIGKEIFEEDEISRRCLSGKIDKLSEVLSILKEELK